MRSPFLDAFIDLTLDEYEPGRASGTRIRSAEAFVDPFDGTEAVETVEPSELLEDEADPRPQIAQVAQVAPPPLPTCAAYVPALRRFAPPRRG